jgi:hypothetical protein
MYARYLFYSSNLGADFLQRNLVPNNSLLLESGNVT